MEPEGSLPHSQVPALCKRFVTGYVFTVRMLAPRPTPKLKDHPLTAVRDCLFNIFAATVHIGGRSSNRNLRTLHAVVTGTHLSRKAFIFVVNSRNLICNVLTDERKDEAVLVCLSSDSVVRRAVGWDGTLVEKGAECCDMTWLQGHKTMQNLNWYRKPKPVG